MPIFAAKGCTMNSKKKSALSKHPHLFAEMFRLELTEYIKPYSIALICYAVALSSAVCSILYAQSLKTAAYALLYVSIIALFAVTAFVPIRSIFVDITKSPKFSGKSPAPSALAAAKLISPLIFSAISSALHAAADATVTYLGQLTYNGYKKSLASVSILLLSLVFYLTCVAITAVSDYKFEPKKSKRSLRRRITMEGILLYALGLTVLMLAFLCLSTIPFGSDALADLSSTGMNPTSSLALSIIYLSVSLLRAVYLFFILKKRLRRALKLYL